MAVPCLSIISFKLKCLVWLCAVFLALSAAAQTADEELFEVEKISVDEAVAVFGMLAMPENIDPAKVAIGDKLFHDPRLSSNDSISCATCHDIATGGDDGLPFSFGVAGQPTARNSPTVFNLQNHVAYFWDGRSSDLHAQIDGPIHSPNEMNTDWETIIGKLDKDPEIRDAINKHYGAMTEAALKDAIVQFQLSLVSNDSAFDEFMAGNENALSPLAQRGLARFVDYGCSSCHQGELVGANLFQRFGIYSERGKGERPLLKVPSLRNVEHTAPYFHDGREADLIGAVRTMAAAQLGRQIEDNEVAEIVAFLQSLSGQRFEQGEQPETQ